MHTQSNTTNIILYMFTAVKVVSFCSSEFHVGNDSLQMYGYHGKDIQNGRQADKNYVEKPCKRQLQRHGNQVTLKIRQSRCWRYVSYYHLFVINLLSSVSTLMLHFWSVMCVVSHSCHAWYIIENEIV